MRRISTNMTNDDMQFQLRNREYAMNSLQNKLASQTRIQTLRDDPTAAAHSTRYQSVIHRLERFSRNVEYAQANHRITEGKVRETVDILQRIRELAVQGANGTYSKDEMKHMGNEVNELLKQIVDLANSKNGDGNTIFSGDMGKSLPFRAVMGNVAGAGEPVVTGVEYIGTIGENFTEVSDGTYMKLNYPGNRVFWAENQQLFSAVDASSYQVKEDTRIFVDGVAVQLNAGDTVQAIISKINDSGVAVKAKLDPLKNGLVLETTTPHQLWLRDSPDGRVLQDLGMLRDNDSPPPLNLNHSVRTFGGSVFDMVMKLRDDFYKGDVIEVGGRGLRGMDEALGNLLASLGDIGSQGKRLDFTYARLQTELPDMKSMNSMTVDLDLTQAITEMKMMEYTHKAALSTAGQILQPTLLDFLR